MDFITKDIQEHMEFMRSHWSYSTFTGLFKQIFIECLICFRPSGYRSDGNVVSVLLQLIIVKRRQTLNK